MLYAKIVLGLPVSGPFDYIVPGEYAAKITLGSRAQVSFGNKRMIGYIVGLSTKSSIKKLKPLSRPIDEEPILDNNMLKLSKKLSEYYCCSWGQAIETAIPPALRAGRKVELKNPGQKNSKINAAEKILIHSQDPQAKWQEYAIYLKAAFAANKSAIIILPDIISLNKAEEKVKNLGFAYFLLYRNQPKELENWQQVRCANYCLVLGLRSAIFAPANNLGLIIIDAEHDQAYKQDQVPHYHLREAALLRTEIEKNTLVLSSASPSLESMLLARKKKFKYKFMEKAVNRAEIKIIDMKRQAQAKREKERLLSGYLESAISLSLAAKEKILLFTSRKGFATLAFCQNCQSILKCKRCNVNLAYHFQNKIMSCPYCGFKADPAVICPECNSGYIKYSGLGDEKIESEISRIFPSSDIVVSTGSVIKKAKEPFNLVGVLSLDSYLSRADFRSAEKTFYLLTGLLGLTKNKMVIQTYCPTHHSFRALSENKPGIFYETELEQRKQLGFPPFRHFAFIRLRGRVEEKVDKASRDLFEKLKQQNNSKALKLISVNPGEPAKLRGNFYRQILLSAPKAQFLSKFLKKNFKKNSYSGIIITIDVDPL